MTRIIIKNIRQSETGTAIVEFALLAPVIIGLMLGVIQIGMSMQSRSAMRDVVSETARYAMVEYQRQNAITNEALETYGETIARSPQFLMNDTVDVTVDDASTLRVPGTFEKTMTITYTPRDIVPFFNFTSREMSYTRPIFLLDE